MARPEARIGSRDTDGICIYDELAKAKSRRVAVVHLGNLVGVLTINSTSINVSRFDDLFCRPNGIVKRLCLRIKCKFLCLFVSALRNDAVCISYCTA
jgi:hypothetical protein